MIRDISYMMKVVGILCIAVWRFKENISALPWYVLIGISLMWLSWYVLDFYYHKKMKED
jgi:hypothetical protein